MVDSLHTNCPNCGAALDFVSPLRATCKYCLTSVVVPPPKGPETVNYFTDSSKFYLLISQKDMQEQYPIQDSVEINVDYDRSSGFGESNSLKLTISTKGVKIPFKTKGLIHSTGTGVLSVAGVGSDLKLTKSESVKILKNGVPLPINTTTVRYGELFMIGDIVFRFQPII